MLPVERFAELDAGDLRDRVRLVGRLERAGEQTALRHRLRRRLRIDAGAAEEQQPLHAGGVGAVDHVGGDREVLVDEVRGPGVVGVDSADLCGREEHELGALTREEIEHPAVIREIELLARRQQQVAAAGRLEPAPDRRADHALAARDEDARGDEPGEFRAVTHGG